MNTWRASASKPAISAKPASLISKNNKSPSNKVKALPEDDDDWETDPDFVNDVTEQEQRWGSKTVVGCGRTAAPLDKDILQVNNGSNVKKEFIHESQIDSSKGYGGKFGVQTDRVDKAALGWEHQEKLQKHASQKDYAIGFGGKYGVQADRKDKSAVGWEHKEKLEKHESQKDYAAGFGGKFGVQKDRVDKSAVGWEHHEKVEKHASQKDYATGFGGKFGVQSDRVDKSALGWDHKEKVEKHTSQTDYSTGFGGKYGVQTDRTDKCAVGWEDKSRPPAHSSVTDVKKGFGGKFGVQTDRVDKSALGWNDKEFPSQSESKSKPVIEVSKGKASDLKARFENLAKGSAEDEAKRKAEEERIKRNKLVQEEREKARKDEEMRQKKLQQQEAEEKLREKVDEDIPSSKNDDSAETESDDKPTPRKIGKLGVSVFPAANVASGNSLNSSVNVDSVSESPREKCSSPAVDTEIKQNLDNGTGENGNHCAINNDLERREPEDNQDVIYEHPEEEEEVQQEQQQQANQVPFIPSGADLGLTAIALYDYQAAEEDEISFDPDELITNIECIDEGWYRGKCRGKIGLFPANFVEMNF